MTAYPKASEKSTTLAPYNDSNDISDNNIDDDDDNDNADDDDDAVDDDKSKQNAHIH